MRLDHFKLLANALANIDPKRPEYQPEHSYIQAKITWENCVEAVANALKVFDNFDKARFIEECEKNRQ
jgi:hypothetical protein